MEKEKKVRLSCPEGVVGVVISNRRCKSDEHDWVITKKWVWVDFDDMIEDKEHPIQFQCYKAYSQSCKNCDTGADVITEEKIPLTTMKMIQFEMETGKHSIWNGKHTIAFKEWLNNK
jgi:hypothetical protein